MGKKKSDKPTRPHQPAFVYNFATDKYGNLITPEQIKMMYKGKKFIKPVAETGKEVTKEVSKVALTAIAVGIGFIAPILWKGVHYLSTTGFHALYDLMIELWNDAHKKTINTSNVKTLLRDMKKKLLLKNPDLKNSTIMNDIKELTKVCYYIDNLNLEGMPKILHEDMKN